jgi:hypothetical protein
LAEERQDAASILALIELLGEPESYPFPEPWAMNYWLGQQRGVMKMDSWWLALRFDEDDRVAQVKVLQD